MVANNDSRPPTNGTTGATDPQGALKWSKPTVPVFVLLPCAHCRDEMLEIPAAELPLERLTKHLFTGCAKAILGTMSAPGSGRVVMAPLCGACSRKLYTPAVLAEAHKRIETR